jgi:hypothetical protein
LFNNSSVDGVSNQQAFFSEDRGRTAVAYTYSLDAVKEFNVSSNSYSAEFGGAAGGQVNSITKSGANAMHGDLFYYLRYPSLNALDPFAKTHGGTPVNGACTGGTTLSAEVNQCIAPPSEHQRQQFGGSLGGAIIKDKLFYFVNYDGQRRVFPIIYTGPSTTNSANAASTMIANNCTANVGAVVGATITGLTAAQCSAAVNFIEGNIGPYPRVANQDVWLAKLDYQLSTNNHLSLSFNSMNFRSPNGYDQSATFSAGSILQNGNFGTHDRFLVANWNTVISPTLVNDFRFQWSRDFQFYAANFSGPSVSLSNLFAYGLRNALPRAAFPDEHRLQFADSISWVHNKHALKFGVDISPVHELLINLFNGGGVYSYNYSDTSVATAATTLQAWIADVYNLPLSTDSTLNNAKCISGGVDYCIGRHYGSFSQANDVINPAQLAGKDDFYDVHYGAYAQDAWKVTPNLTMNLGVRWDMQWIPQPAHPYTTDPLALYYTQKINVSKLNFAPRLGIAWQVEKNTVVRAGYGMFYANTSDSLLYNTRVENGVVQKTFGCNANYTPSSGAFSAATSCLPAPLLAIQTVPGIPNVLFNVPGPTLQAPPFTGATAVTPTSLNVNPSSLNVSSLNIRGQSPHFLEPMVNEMELGVEHQFAGNISFSETFMYTRGQHLPTCPDANLAAPGTPITKVVNGVLTTFTPPSTVTYTAGVLTTSNGLFANGSAAPAANSTVTVPFYTSRIDPNIGIISACQSLVHSQYVAGITTVKKQFSHGFEMLLNYTLAKANDDGQVQGSSGTFSGSSDAVLDPLNEQGEWGASDYDQRQRLVISTLYTPTFRVENRLLSALVNGFGFGGIVTVASPLPVNALINSATPPSVTVATANGSTPVAGIDGGITGGESLNAGTTAGRIPNVAKNFYRGNTQIRAVDFRITRDIKFTERLKFQVIGEAFNVFNHTNVAGVTSTAYAYLGAGAPQTVTVNGVTSTVFTCPVASVNAGCVVPQTSFLVPNSTSNTLGGARQLQISGKLFF